MVRQLNHGKLDIARFNYGLLSFLPKVKGADKLQVIDLFSY
jgi:hypothetical protein